jgi:dTDP-4-amino-4,6-dideoxygalactose transaminase
MNRRKLGDSEDGGRLRASPWPLADPLVADVLSQMARDGTWGRYDGPHAERLSEALAQYHAIESVYLCASGTFAVELALRALGVQAGDEVVLAAYDFPGNFRAVEAIGATAVLVDIERGSTCLDSICLEEACRSGKVRAIIVSHLHGGLADMAKICHFAHNANVGVVEDACQAVGADVQGRKAGTWGDVGTLSFGGSKLLTAGRGGALLTRRADVLQRAKIFCERGNHAFPLSEMQAAVLLPQLQQLDQRNRLRRSQASILGDALKLVTALSPITTLDRGAASLYKLGWQLQSPDPSALTRDIVLQAAWKIGADLGAGFRGFARRGERRCRRVGELPNSEAAAQQTILLHHSLFLTATTEELQWLAATLSGAIQSTG